MTEVDTQALKAKAARHAVEFVESGMVVGLGSGTTAILAVRYLAEQLASGTRRDLVGIATSLETAREAERLGIPLGTLEDHPEVDLTIDGADEVDPQLNLIKGGGGALLREKIVAQASRREVIIVDPSKSSETLGTRWPVPVEVVPFGWSSQRTYLERLGAAVRLRADAQGAPFVTDHGNYILDCHFGPITDPPRLATLIRQRVGVVEHGLFLGLASDVLIATPQCIEHRRRDRSVTS